MVNFINCDYWSIHNIVLLCCCNDAFYISPVSVFYRHDWYQTESQVIVTVMAKNVPKDGVCVNFMEKEVQTQN